MHDKFVQMFLGMMFSETQKIYKNKIRNKKKKKHIYGTPGGQAGRDKASRKGLRCDV